MFLLDTKSDLPLHRQLYEALKDDILRNKKAGDKLPSIRKIATIYNLSKTTVENAYAQLYAEGYIISRPKSGYFVDDFDFNSIDTAPAPTPQPMQTEEKTYRFDFFPAQLSNDIFPLKTWKRLYNRVLESGLDFGSYPVGQGEQQLREEIACYLSCMRGVNTYAENIIITAGFSDAMGLLARLIKPMHDALAMEHPGYHITRKVFEAHGYDIASIPVESKGISLDDLKQSGAKVVYITPSHQYPTGVAMPLAARQHLITYIASVGGIIIEDDYDSELRYEGRPIPALQGLDKNGCVVYVGTFAKSLSPALRIGYIVLPTHVMQCYLDSYEMHFARVSLPLQRTMALFLQEGHYEKTIRKFRTLYRRKHNLMRDTLKTLLGNTMRIVAQGGGLAILIHPTVPFDWEQFKKSAEDARLKIYLAKERSGGEFEAVRMGFGGFSNVEIVEAVEAFREVWFGAIIKT